MQGRLAEAVSLLERALALNVEIGRIEGELVNLGNLGIAYGELGDWRRAEDYLVRAHAIGVAVGSQSAQAVSLSNLVDSAVQIAHTFGVSDADQIGRVSSRLADPPSIRHQS